MIGSLIDYALLALMLGVALGVHLAAKKAGYDVLAALRRIYDRVVAGVLTLIRRFDR